MSQIIELKQFRRSSIRCPAVGLVFPQLYRRRGVEWTFKEGEDATNFSELIPGDRPEILYSLAVQEDDDAIANSEWDAIEHPSAEYESGWLIVRHHKSYERVEGYLDAHGDLDTRGRVNRMVFQTTAGLFTIVERDPLPGRPTPLIVYTTRVPHPLVGEDCWTKVLGLDGAEVDPASLLPDTLF